MAGDDHLNAPARFVEDVDEHARGGGMKSGLRFLDTHQPGAPGSAGALKQGCQHAQHPQRSVRHVVREKAPGVGVAPHLLPKLQRQLRADRPGFDTVRSGHHPREVVSDTTHIGRRVRLHAIEDAGDVAAVPVEQIARIGGLELPDLRGIQVVEPHPRQGVVHRPERFVSGRRQKIEAVASAGRGRMRNGVASVLAVFYPEEAAALGFRRSDDALLAPNEVPTLGPGADFERVPAGCVGHVEADADGEVVGVAARAAPNLVDPATLAQGVFRRETQGLCREAERVEEVALAGSVGPHEKRERRQLDIASGDALVVSQADPGDRGGIGRVQ